ncbi:MAG TPA: EAL domain-containing protein [Thermoanaerobaculia bacterium]|nr:EAL domain-containing protein [Thermoanaerobaculia bacterium]
MAEKENDAQELAQLVKRLDRHRRARQATDSISGQSTRALYEKQEHLRLLQAVAIAANESSSLDDAIASAVDQICEDLGWPVGHAYLTVTQILVLSDLWFVADLQRFAGFRAALESTPLPAGGGLPGEAIASRKPVWTADVSAAAHEAGLKTAIAIPVIGDEGTVAVLEFFSEQQWQPEPGAVEVLGRIGDLLGKVHIRTKTEATFRSSEEQFRLLFEGNPNPMWIYDADTLQFIAVNDAAVAQYGWGREEIQGMTLDALQPEDGQSAAALREHPPASMRIRTRNGEVLQAEITAYEVRLPGRRARLAMAVESNAARRTEEALRESERRFREMLDTIELLAVLLDVVGTITYCNPYLLRVTGYTKPEVVGRNFFELFVSPERRDSVGREFLENIGRGIVAAHMEMEIVTREGERRIILWNDTILRGPEASVIGAASVGSDVTEQRAVESQLLHNAFHDSLTGLPNRALFLDRVEHALQWVHRSGRKPFAVLLLDIDYFKNVNDSLGHVAGDQLLLAIGERLSRCVRAADTVARFGGDEFTVLIESIDGVRDVNRATQRIHDEIAAPFVIDGQEIYTTASIGVAIAGAEYEKPEQIIRDADTAMYQAKAQGRGNSEIFDVQMRAEAVARLQMEIDLRHGLDRNELLLMYQPIVNLRSADIVGFEALVRWNHPKRGLIPPMQFIPLAEETGLIVPVGEWVLREACRQAALWRAQPLGRNLRVSVNISSRQLSQEELAEVVRDALAAASLEPSALHLEITESAIMQNPESAFAIIEQIRKLGCNFAIDDFGTGYSSLSYLHRMAIDQLKIDSSFVQSGEPKSAEIIRSIVDLGRSLGLEVVAEGIETTVQANQLRGLQCAYGQGFLFSRPVDREQALQMVCGS